MKILFITRKYPPAVGGMETFSAGFVQALGSVVAVWPLRGAQINLLWWYPVTLVRALFYAKQFDVIHCGDGVLALLGALVARVTRCPVTITLHGLDVTYRMWPYQPVLRWSLRQLAHCVCVSRATADTVKQHGVLERNVSIVSNGVNVADWPSAAADLPVQAQAPKQLLTVGRLVPRKGVAWFMTEVLPKLKTPVHYHVVGSGPEFDTLQTAITRHHLEKCVTLHGRVDDSRLLQLYQHADLFIMPNISVPNNPEGFGIVALEAAACGLPVIAARLEGISDAVVDGDTGFLLESGSVLAWIECLDRVLLTAPLSAKHVRTAVAQRFGWQAVGQQYRNLFNYLIVSANVKR